MDELELYQQMMSKDPSSQIFVYLAEALLEQEMYEEAIETCVNGLRLRPHDLRARVILGVSYLRTGQLDRAETELLKAKEMLEINTVTYHALADLYDKKGDFEQAGHYRELFQAIHPAGSAEIETESGRATEEFPPEETEKSTITMAQLHEEHGHLEEAAAAYRKIFETSPETEGAEDKPTALEQQTGEAQLNRDLLSILKSWQSKMQDRVAPERTSSSSRSPSIDPEKLVAFAKKHIKEKRSP